MAGSDATVLSQGVGYGVVVGIGFFFSVVMIGISMLQVLGPNQIPYSTLIVR